MLEHEQTVLGQDGDRETSYTRLPVGVLGTASTLPSNTDRITTSFLDSYHQAQVS
jgi:hypothetical protein